MINSLKYQDYTASIQYSTDDEVFFGKVVGITDLITFEGTSVAELKAAFKEAVEDYFESCKNLGKTPDKTYKGMFNVRVPAGLHKKAATFASLHDISLNDFVKTAIIYAVNHEDDFSSVLLDNSEDYGI
ncbi:type II toxin-antitoxin system HicB family antitoxin [Pedobacter cryophilus]|uniref:Type II toxin-antitoxin system HicB family antitoxin n=1 Tax=Pedobacter cryophilus TaxID=2571271 RepID=A0A4U1C7L6_9SPHI|nr:type II toxin-antitoxin system HicB family antitoxin [Pedobacter cryophilus]TKC00397.1 type II toxin-antitoxin system HicB family antitoxin [Pedobacter cryophilus]